MAGGRRYITASEFCASVRDGTHDSPKAVAQGRKLVTSRHLTTGRIELSDAYLISEEDFEAINKRSKVDCWDVFVSMIGTVGAPCLIKDEPDFAIKNIGLFETKSEADGKLLYDFLRSKDMQQSVVKHSRGATQQYIPLGALRDFPILVADDPEEQKAIAAVLGALDDKIELNRRMNATPEAMARALFQSCFVDFDPVRRNMDKESLTRRGRNGISETQLPPPRLRVTPPMPFSPIHLKTPNSDTRQKAGESAASTRPRNISTASPTVFGDYISIYDIQRAVADEATKPIYYESRIAKLALNAAELPKLAAEFEELTEGEELTKKEKLNTKWAALEALPGDPKRIALIAGDLVTHFEKRLEAMEGKAMIVCMSRRICVDLFNALIKLRPEWDAETLKVVMTGSAEDGPDWQRHIGNKEKRHKLANRFKDARDPFKIVIVRDMWLTGFDAPCLHTMYADKPMQGHGLMQAIARVNRVFQDKPSGLIVDYLGLADQLKRALATCTESGGQGNPTYDTKQAISVMLEKHGVACDMMHGFTWDKWTTGTPTERLQLIPAGQEHILQQEYGKKGWVQVVLELSRAFVVGEVAQGRTQSALEEEPRAESAILRETQEDPQRLPQPCHQHDGSH